MSEAVPRPARPLVLAAPSGTGKTTIARSLVNGSREFVFSVSATTRPPRAGERNGMDYDFLDVPAFERMRKRGELVEWAEVHGHYYGTPRRNIEQAAERGEHVVLDIDVQGARQIRDHVPDALLVFVLPPSAAALVRRLSGRGTEARREMVRRLRNAREELLAARGFDRQVVNDRLERAVDVVRDLVREAQHGGGTEAASAGSGRLPDLEERVERLRREIDEVLERVEEDGALLGAAESVRHDD